MKRVPNHGSLTLPMLGRGKVSRASIPQIFLRLGGRRENARLVPLLEGLQRVGILFRRDPISSILVQVEAGWQASVWAKTTIFVEGRASAAESRSSHRPLLHLVQLRHCLLPAA